MKTLFKYLILSALVGVLFVPTKNLIAGNEDRSGQAGASELLINPWARSSGWGSANTSCVHGLEAIFLNVAGIAFTKKTELVFARTNWLKGSDVDINAFGFTQKAGENGVIGLGIMSMTFGDINITTVDLPEGGKGTFSPQYMNINMSYARAFSNSIYGGINFKVITESISNVSAQGLAIDAGIQYVTGSKPGLENIKFGIALKNVGSRLKFSGDGLTFRGFVPGASNESTISQRSAEFELPSLINIGAAYEINFSENLEKHKLTIAGNFTSNSFIKDQYSLGLEYSFIGYLKLRVGYTFEEGMLDDTERTTAFTGPSTGFSIDIPMNKEKGNIFSFDYSYRSTDPFDGTHSIGARISL